MMNLRRDSCGNIIMVARATRGEGEILSESVIRNVTSEAKHLLKRCEMEDPWAYNAMVASRNSFPIIILEVEVIKKDFGRAVANSNIDIDKFQKTVADYKTMTPAHTRFGDLMSPKEDSIKNKSILLL